MTKHFFFFIIFKSTYLKILIKEIMLYNDDDTNIFRLLTLHYTHCKDFLFFILRMFAVTSRSRAYFLCKLFSFLHNFHLDN